jgi:hypothetical protein
MTGPALWAASSKSEDKTGLVRWAWNRCVQQQLTNKVRWCEGKGGV